MCFRIYSFEFFSWVVVSWYHAIHFNRYFFSLAVFGAVRRWKEELFSVKCDQKLQSTKRSLLQRLPSAAKWTIPHLPSCLEPYGLLRHAWGQNPGASIYSTIIEPRENQKNTSYPFLPPGRRNHVTFLKSSRETWPIEDSYSLLGEKNNVKPPFHFSRKKLLNPRKA